MYCSTYCTCAKPTVPIVPTVPILPRDMKDTNSTTGGRATPTHIRFAKDGLVAFAVDPKVSLLAFVNAVALTASRDVRTKC